MHAAVLSVALLLPDRLPSLVLLVGFWVPPAVLGWITAASLGATPRHRAPTLMLGFAAIVNAAAWFLVNVGRMPPYIPGATTDPTFAPPEAVSALAILTVVLVLPGSALAAAVAFRRRKHLTPPHLRT